ncbi:thermonuclease family protein [uncultured Azohydromonas sp.]|uniref:thermonuclease family protein n=1 Tax=uncultured Azohydromonas sp. TaxID=487342 RepID=UPI00262E7FE6|nr:thermonuclease family protein [uncultured Azohydromonas sp.]
MATTLPALLVCLVVGISDGDTLTVRCEAAAQTLRVRLAQVDAPEKRQPFGERSRQAMAAFCFRQQAEIRPQDTDRYGRTVAHVRCAGRDAGTEQVRAGVAWALHPLPACGRARVVGTASTSWAPRLVG